MKMSTLQDLFVHELQDVYHAEKQITKALPKMAKKASSPELADAFATHLAETEEQIRRIEQIFDELDVPAKTKTCKGMQGLLDEGEEMLKANADDDVHDAGMIIGAQKVEHYEIAAYGSLRSLARTLGYSQAAQLLETTLREEEATDKKLTRIAESTSNVHAPAV